MKFLVDVKDEKADFLLEVLKNFKFVKTEPLTGADNRLVKELKEAVDEVNLYKQGKLKPKSAEEWLSEL